MDAEGVGQGPDVVQADVSLAALHAAYVSAVESSPVTELFLGEAEWLPQFTDALAECTTPFGAVGLRLGHRINVYE